MDYQDFEKLYRKDPNMAPPLLTKNMDFCLSSGSLFPVKTGGVFRPRSFKISKI